MTDEVPHLPFLYLSLACRFCHANVQVNGFPVLELNGTSQAITNSFPINPFLVGNSNRILLSLDPIDNAFRHDDIKVTLRTFADGDIVSPESGEHRLLYAEYGPHVDGAERLVLSYRFASFGFPSFYEELMISPRIFDRDRLERYGRALLGLFFDQNVSDLMQEMEPKILAYARAYGKAVSYMREDLCLFLSKRLFCKEPEPMKSLTQPTMIPYCGGRIWEILRPDLRPLFVTRPDIRGARTQIRIFVGLRDGHLCVVR